MYLNDVNNNWIQYMDSFSSGEFPELPFTVNRTAAWVG